MGIGSNIERSRKEPIKLQNRLFLRNSAVTAMMICGYKGEDDDTCINNYCNAKRELFIYSVKYKLYLLTRLYVLQNDMIYMRFVHLFEIFEIHNLITCCLWNSLLAWIVNKEYVSFFFHPNPWRAENRVKLIKQFQLFAYINTNNIVKYFFSSSLLVSGSFSLCFCSSLSFGIQGSWKMKPVL